ncbi:MAG: hypothetical protein JSV81_07470 [Anaerolineales bacterium]|nr:MAG: hypothetical protein JSV81_07470 [Anaerolineales bacterium]
MSFSVQVECYSSHTYAQEPRAFTWHGERYEVKRIIKRWRTPEGPSFRVQATPTTHLQHLQRALLLASASKPEQAPASPLSRLVDLSYLESEDEWELTIRNFIEEDQR